ncbi:MAG TPA: alpha/beta hydrolase [Kofleriaceae bacterium]
MEIKYVTANGLRFAYLEAGPSDGPLVLLIHGFPDCAYSWDASMTALAADGYRCVAYFQRGYSPSEIPADGKYDVDTLAADALALIPALGAQTAVIVGHDWGAGAAYGAAALEPDRVKALVTLAIPHPGGVRFTPNLLWATRHFLTLNLPGAVKKLRADNFALIDHLWHRWDPGWKNIPASETAHAKEALRPAGHAEAAVGYYKTLRRWIPASHRLQIRVPTAAFAGTEDIVSTRVYEKSRKMFTAAYEVVQIPGGHFAHRQHPDVFIPELRRVVREKSAAVR